jgi:hypothetical protein
VNIGPGTTDAQRDPHQGPRAPHHFRLSRGRDAVMMRGEFFEIKPPFELMVEEQSPP